MTLQKRIRWAAALAVQLFALAGPGSTALAQTSGSTAQQGTSATAPSSAEVAAIKLAAAAADVVRQMAAEPGLPNLLAQAKGVYIVPTYGRAALGLGAAGGAGVLVTRRPDGTWSDPAFFNIGGISVGAQAGAEGGPIALLLMNDKAVGSFRKKNNFSLSADAGLTVVNWSKQAQGMAGTGDVVVWSGTKGLFGNVATLAVNDIRYNQRANRAYYGKNVTVDDVMVGKATNPHSDPLKQALASTAAPAK
jgi:lipid-binding SYLF domain-containing protein